jgi:transcriptional regulator with XRE-family HTH domain
MKSDPNREPSGFGRLLRFLRERRGLSQLALSSGAGTTPRHLSFVETGRSRPGRDLILRLATALQLSSREINQLLGLAGFQAARAEYQFGDQRIEPYRAAIEAVLENHNPYPGCAMNGAGDILLANKGYKDFAPTALTSTPEERVETFFNPLGDAPKLVENWAEVAHGLLDRQRAELAGCFNQRLEKMVLRMEKHLKNVVRPQFKGGNDIVLSPILLVGDKRLSTFSTFMKFSHAHEVTLSEIRVELTFPTDEKTRLFFEELAKK